MSKHRTARDRARQGQRRVVVWGCGIHRTPAGAECQGCADQYQLLTWDDINPDHRRPR
jgi:hypothetical protein